MKKLPPPGHCGSCGQAHASDARCPAGEWRPWSQPMTRVDRGKKGRHSIDWVPFDRGADNR